MQQAAAVCLQEEGQCFSDNYNRSAAAVLQVIVKKKKNVDVHSYCSFVSIKISPMAFSSLFASLALQSLQHIKKPYVQMAGSRGVAGATGW